MATYNANLNETVQVLSNDTDNRVYAPTGASNGHWFAVKIIRTFSAVTLTTAIDGNGSLIEDVDGRGPLTETAIGFNYEYSSFIYIDGTWWRQQALPYSPQELFAYDGASLLINVNTPIPLTEFNPFSRPPVYWDATTAGDVGGVGNIKCVKSFAGTFVHRVYFEFVLPGNNQDATGLVDFYIVDGTPGIIQGKGCGGSFAGPRAGTFYQTILNYVTVIAAVGDIIGMRGSDDPGQTGMSYIIDDTGIIIQGV